MRRISVLFLVSAVLMAIPSAAAAQGVPSDPEADSPSGVVYEIPAERGRKDAAPRDRTRQSQGDTGGSQSGGGSSGGGTSGGSSGDSGAVSGDSGGGSGASETSIRSDNNFGTSSNVPGAASKDREGSGRSDGGSGRSGADSSDSGGGSVGDVAATAARSTTASTEGPSDEIVIPLIVVLVAAGILIGIVASRRAFRGRG